MPRFPSLMAAASMLRTPSHQSRTAEYQPLDTLSPAADSSSSSSSSTLFAPSASESIHEKSYPTPHAPAHGQHFPRSSALGAGAKKDRSIFVLAFILAFGLFYILQSSTHFLDAPPQQPGGADGNGDGAVGTHLKENDIDNLIVLGDSYSDNCNLWRRIAPTEETKDFLFPLCPSPPIGRSSAGRTWPELLALGSSVTLHNFAHSAATCSNKLVRTNYVDPEQEEHRLPSVLDEQIGLMEPFLEGIVGEGRNSSRTAAVILVGTNDLGGILATMRDDGKADALRTEATTDDIAHCVLETVQALHGLGVYKVLVMTPIPLERAPLFSQDNIGEGFKQDGAHISSLMGGLVQSYRQALMEGVGDLHNDEEGSSRSVQIFDTYKLFEEIYDDPERIYGPRYNINEWCHDCRTGTCKPCPEPESYMFSDDLHPSVMTQQVMAAHLAVALGLNYHSPLVPHDTWT